MRLVLLGGSNKILLSREADQGTHLANQVFTINAFVRDCFTRVSRDSAQPSDVSRKNLLKIEIHNGQMTTTANRPGSVFSQASTSVLVFLLFICLLASNLFPGRVANAQVQPAQPLPENIFRLERVQVDGGGELITIHAKLVAAGAVPGAREWVPLVTVLRDTLGDLTPENDRLRYVWPLTYTRPSLKQRISGAVPFLYTRVGNKTKFSGSEPPPVLDLASADQEVWNRVFWVALQSLLLDPYGMPIKASTRSYQQNIGDYRRSHIIRALAVLSLYQAVAEQGQSSSPAFSESELAEIQARLRLTDKTFGGLLGDLNLQRYNEKQLTQAQDERGHNWELLRQRAEAESLYFEPLQMPDGSTTHALLWVAKPDLEARRNQPYDKRFLNIANPWSDKRLATWPGPTETRYFDSDNHPIAPDTPDARAIEMIPLALYGLDNPKIPMLLVDFRDALNPKKREMSRRVLQDVSRNVLSFSRFGQPAYFLGRSVFDFVTGRRGMDINQPSRLRTYSQLKLLLSLNNALDPSMRKEIDARLEKVSLNPLENDLAAESQLAFQQYDALMAYAKRPNGLPAKLDRDRRAELVPLEHGKAERVLFRLGNILSFGKYNHREHVADGTPSVNDRLDVARRLTFHTRFLLQVAKSTPRVEVIWNLDEVKRSLQFIADHGAEASSAAIAASSSIFLRTDDTETRRLCLDSLSRINSRKAKEEMLRISCDKRLDPAGRDLIGAYLQKAKPQDPLAAAREKTSSETGQQ